MAAPLLSQALVHNRRMVHDRRWCTNGASAQHALVHERRWCMTGAGARQALVHDVRWGATGAGERQALVHDRRLHLKAQSLIWKNHI